MIPCKENKCILLPICNNKESVQCNLLDEYFESEGRKQVHSIIPVWIRIKKVLPPLKQIVFHRIIPNNYGKSKIVATHDIPRHYYPELYKEYKEDYWTIVEKALTETEYDTL